MTDDEQKAVDFLDKQLAEQGFSDQTLRRKVASLGASLALKSAQQPTAPQPLSQSEKPKKPTKEKLVNLELPIPEKARPVSNVAARAALFAAIQGEDRELLDKAVLASQDGIEIIFTGRQLNQDDHDTFMQLVYMGDHKQLGEDVTVPANAILAGLGRGNGKSQHEQLKNEIHRLVTGTVNIKSNGINFIGHFLDDAVQDERLAQNKRHWTYRLNPKVAELFGRSQFTLIDWEQRKALKQKDLARWLHLYLSSHATPFPVSVEFIHRICGSRTKALKKFRENLRIALNSIKEAGIITAWHMDKGDIVHIERLASRSLSQSEGQRTAEAILLPPLEQHLHPATVEKFRQSYPRFDPYACKSDFDTWIRGKTYPTNYDAAFLGFAEAWVKGKF